MKHRLLTGALLLGSTLAHAQPIHWTFSYTGFYDRDAAVFLDDLQLAGSFAGDDADGELERWAARIRTWAENGDVYCYFDNDIKVRAPFDALRLMEMVGERWPR